MDKWESLQQLIDRMPGGRFIRTGWKDEPLTEIEIDFDPDDASPTREYSFAANVLIAALEEYGPPAPGDEGFLLQVPPLIEEMLEFWSDGECSYYVL